MNQQLQTQNEQMQQLQDLTVVVNGLSQNFQGTYEAMQ